MNETNHHSHHQSPIPHHPHRYHSDIVIPRPTRRTKENYNSSHHASHHSHSHHHEDNAQVHFSFITKQVRNTPLLLPTPFAQL